MMLLSYLRRTNRRALLPISGHHTSSRRLRLESLEERCLLTGFDVVYYWNQVAIEATRIDHGADAPQLQFGPTRASRALAMVSGAVFDAVNSIDRSYTPYLVSVDAPPDASLEAAAAFAAHDTLVALYPYQQDSFDVALARSLVGIPDVPAAEGAAVGQYVAQSMLDARANDGSDATMDYQYGQYPGQWRADPLNPDTPPLGPLWGYVTPFVVPNAQGFWPPAPPAITSIQYAAAYQEVKSIGALFSTARTQQETNIGVFWGYDAQPGLCAPVRLYNQIAEVLSVQMHNTEVQNARFFALINLAMADAAISVWGAKFSYDFWRPITAIRENDPGTGPTGLGSGNPYLVDQGDPDWQPFGAPAHDGSYLNFTPPFPSYTSGHAGIGGAMFAMMTDFFGRDEVPFTVATDEYNTLAEDQNGDPVPLDPRSFSRFSEAAEENGQSRIYLGIHYHFDKVEGIQSGYMIADYIFQNALKPVTPAARGSGAAIATSVLNNVLEPLWAAQMRPWIDQVTLGSRASLAVGIAGVISQGTEITPVALNIVGPQSSETGQLIRENMNQPLTTSPGAVPAISAMPGPAAGSGRLDGSVPTMAVDETFATLPDAAIVL
jgi:hypothetical protein